ncbi:hypothetical protein AQ436_00225 [Arthrobacter sp. EpRS66]|nr:hypothetical protein AQ436_00225 [Arthrobacter sp. EpRS66]
MTTSDDDIQNDILGEKFDLSCIENLSSILAQVPDQEPPVIKREARYLSGNDIGKTVSARGFTGELCNLATDEFGVELGIEVEHGKVVWPNLDRDELVTITGKEQL